MFSIFVSILFADLLRYVFNFDNDLSPYIYYVFVQSLHSILVDPAVNISAFEFVHYKTHIKLMRYLTVDQPESAVPLNTRLRHFLHTFMGLPVSCTIDCAVVVDYREACCSKIHAQCFPWSKYMTL